MPAIHGVRETALYCDDLARCAAFYRKLLDREPMLDTPRLVAFDAGHSTVLLLFQRGATTVPIEAAGGPVPGHHGLGPVHLAFGIEEADVEPWIARLGELGIAVESTVRWERGGRSVYFRDLEGRSIELVTPRTWPSW